MFRNNYDNDSVTFSPQGRIFQVEYAGEAVKQGSVVVGIVSNTHAVLAAVMRNAEEMSYYQKKIIEIAPHCGIGFAGLTSDARVLSRFMQSESRREHLWFSRPIMISKLTSMIGDRAQRNTQLYGRRPYGVGLLVAGHDRNGPHLFEFQPSGVVNEMVACAIGARSQMARTYLERNVQSYPTADRNTLITHALRALRESLGKDKQLTIENTACAIVGHSDLEPFTLVTGPKIQPMLDLTDQAIKNANDLVNSEPESMNIE